MRRDQRLMVRVALSGAMLIGVLVIPGCSGDEMKTGTMVERKPEQVAAEKASMEGMKKAMENMRGQGKAK